MNVSTSKVGTAHHLSRRALLASVATAATAVATPWIRGDESAPYTATESPKRYDGVRGPGKPIRITRLETLLVQPRWLFLRVHADDGSVVDW